MKAKDYLNQIRIIDKIIKCKQEEINNLRNQLLYKGIVYGDKVQSGNVVDDITAKLIAKIVDYDNELHADIRKMLEIRKDVMDTINQLNHEPTISILYKRYFHFIKWEQIAMEEGYTFQWVHKLHSKALIEIERILERKQEK